MFLEPARARRMWRSAERLSTRHRGSSGRATGPVGADESEEIALSLLAFRADLREPGGDHTDRAHACVERRPHRVDDCARRDAYDREVDLVGDVADGAPRTPATDSALRFTGYAAPA